jgi:hypothetical protein
MKQSHIIRTSSILIGILLNSSILMAGTIVEIKNNNDVTTILTDGKQARMNSGGTDYVIVNYANNSVKVVDTEKHQVMSLDIEDLPKGGNPPKINTAVKNLGSGPVIAGYKTQKFNYSVNGQSCGQIFGSKDVYQLEGIKDLFNAMGTIAERQQAIMGGFSGMVDNCTLGDMKMTEQVKAIGVPMRTVDKGRVDMEIQSIKLDADLPADTFVIPASYKTVTMKEEMQVIEKDMMKMQQQMQQYQPQMQEMMRQHEPQMQEMMRQMQQSGQMTPEMMEQMRQAQEMMKQYQQQ